MNKRVSRIFLVEDHPLFRQGLASLIGRHAEFKICGEAESADEAIAAMRELRPDAAIVDLSLKSGSGTELIRRLKAVLPQTAIVVLSMHDERHHAERSFRAGALGYVMKSESPSAVIDALRRALAGKSYLSEQMRAVAVERFLYGAAPVALPQDVLSNRELEVFELLGQGYETRRVAETLGLNIKTVQTFCAKIKDKLHLANASELVREAVRWTESGTAT